MLYRVPWARLFLFPGLYCVDAPGVVLLQKWQQLAKPRHTVQIMLCPSGKSFFAEHMCMHAYVSSVIRVLCLTSLLAVVVLLLIIIILLLLLLFLLFYFS